MLVGDGVLDEGPLQEFEVESEESMSFGPGGEAAEGHLMLQDDELRDYLNEGEAACSRIAQDALVPLSPDTPNLMFPR